MFSKVMARMVERAMPGDPGDPHQEWIAAEAAENAIRQTARIALLVGLLVLVLAGALVYRYVALPGREDAAAPAVAAEALKQLGADNARLTEQNQELQKKIDGLTKERLALQDTLADLEKQMADLAKKPQAAVAATKPAAPTKAAGAPRSPKQVTAPEPARVRAAPEGTQPAETFHCGDGRTVPDPTVCAPAGTAASPPTDQRDPRRTYQCGDGRTARDPEACGPPGGSPSAR